MNKLYHKISAFGILILFFSFVIHPVLAEESRATNKLNINYNFKNKSEIFLGFRIIRGSISNKSFEDNYFEFHAERIVNFNFSIFKGNLIPVISRDIIENRNIRINNIVNYTGFIGKNNIFLIRDYTDSS
jgi:hypothetical protein